MFIHTDCIDTMGNTFLSKHGVDELLVRLLTIVAERNSFVNNDQYNHENNGEEFKVDHRENQMEFHDYYGNEYGEKIGEINLVNHILTLLHQQAISSGT